MNCVCVRGVFGVCVFRVVGVGVHIVSSRLILCYVHIMLVSILLNFL